MSLLWLVILVIVLIALRHHGQTGVPLVDADLVNNTLGWQWVAGCGVDAAPYFRVSNPYTQAKKFDPDGAYIKRWLPELAQLPVTTLHEPWRDPDVLAACGYPEPMVDVGASREAALAAWKSLD